MVKLWEMFKKEKKKKKKINGTLKNKKQNEIFLGSI
jgi:hypothetical protein